MSELTFETTGLPRLRSALRGFGDRVSSLGIVATAALLAGAAVVVRLPFFFGEHQVLYRSDARVYLQLAHGISHGQGFQDQHFWTPGYPAMEAVLGLLPGRAPDAATVTQHLLGVAVVVAVVVFGWRYFGRPAAWVAGAIAALSPTLVIQEHSLLPDFVFGVLLLAGGLLLAEAVRNAVSLRLLAAAGVVFGLGAWVKPAGELLFLAAVPALLFATRDVRRTLTGSLVVAAALLVTISPWLVRNAVRFDLYSMSNQADETLFWRAFDVDRMPIPLDHRYGGFAEAIRRRNAAQAQGRPLTFDFHYGLRDRLGVSDDQARAAEGELARLAIRRHPGTYLSGTVRELRDADRDLGRFTGQELLPTELDRTRPPVGRASTTAIWDAVRPAYGLWWILSLHAATGLLLLFTGARSSRNAAAALLSVSVVVALGTAMAHGAEWRYSIQLAPIVWMVASGGLAILVASVRARMLAGRATDARGSPRRSARPDPPGGSARRPRS
jgi:4-amino-4-deoxy-L-arabinose transferase-like glycosyltransferase